MVDYVREKTGLQDDVGTTNSDFFPAQVFNKNVMIPTVEGICELDGALPYNLVLYNAIHPLPLQTGTVSRSLKNTNGTIIKLEDDQTFINSLPTGTYVLNYRGTVITTSTTTKITYSYYFAVVENKLPLKKWTITDVVLRCLELAEPLRQGQNPRFTFDGVEYINGERQKPYREGSQAEKYDKVLSPEFFMTRQTLRQALQQVGGFIHAEPRLRKGVFYFDEYGQREMAGISAKKHISLQAKHDINEFHTGLDSQAENLVNRLDWAKGVVVEPFSGGYQTLRCETSTVRMGEDDSTYIATKKPIYQLSKGLGSLYCRYATQVADNGLPTAWSQAYDLTPYVFEKADYDNLSSYGGTYPYAKAFALYYTQGKEGIFGLWHKDPKPITNAFDGYAIVNILRLVSGNQSLGISAYPLLSFQIAYAPIFRARIPTPKAIRLDTKYPRNLVYNQGANQIETRYYGENLKGVSARLGNIDKTVTYKVGYLSDIPKSGQLYDDEYYISAVSAEIQPLFIKVTLGLSKDFNRLSQYIGISSENRLYEVSEKSAMYRDSLKNEYVVITSDENRAIAQTNGGFFAGKTCDELKAMFTADYSNVNGGRISFAKVSAYSKNNTNTPLGNEMLLPVTSAAFGNTMSFGFNFEDNYSAGQKQVYFNSTTDSVKGYWGQYVPYCDYYGRAYWLGVQMVNDENPVLTPATSYPMTLPEAQVASTSIAAATMLWRKDSREIPSYTFALSYVADINENFVIGSAIANKCQLVTGEKLTGDKQVKIYFLDKPIGLFDKKADLTGLTGYALDSAYVGTSGCAFKLSFNAGTTDETINKAPKNAKAWVIATPPATQSINVEDEDGEEITQEINTGSEILLGNNVDIQTGEAVAMPTFYIKEKLY